MQLKAVDYLKQVADEGVWVGMVWNQRCSKLYTWMYSIEKLESSCFCWFLFSMVFDTRTSWVYCLFFIANIVNLKPALKNFKFNKLEIQCLFIDNKMNYTRTLMIHSLC